MLTTLHELLDEAQRNGGAVLAFNVYNLETVLAVAEGAAETGAPVVFAFGEGYLQGVSLAMIGAMVRQAILEHGVRAALHLDHAKRPDTVRAALEAGFTSVMFDGSSLPFERNVRETSVLAREAHKAGASIEGELGGLNAEDGTDDGAARLFTEPDQAAVFVRETAVDALAVSVGNAHGVYRDKPDLRIDLIRKISQTTGSPLALHGGSGIPAEQMRLAIRAGIRKINVNTELALAGTRAILDHASHNPSARLEAVMEQARSAMKDAVIDAILSTGRF